MNFLQTLARGVERAERKSMTAAQPLGYHYNPGQPVHKYDFDPDKAVVEGFKACVWVFACTSLLMRAVGSVPWTAKKSVDSKKRDEWEADPTDWRTALLEYPNEEMTRQFAMAWMTSHLALNGEAPQKIAWLNERPKKPGAIYPLHPHRFSPIAGANSYVQSYEWYERGKRVEGAKEDIIFHRLPDPDNILRGCGMLQATWKAVKANTAGQEWRANIFERGGIPPGAVRDENITNETDLNEAADMVEKAWKSSAGKGRPMVWAKGSEWIPFSYNASDLQFLEGQEFTVTEICAAFGVHPALFFNEAATYDNMKAAIRHYWVNGAIPLLDTFRDSYNLALVSKAERDSVWIDYDLSGVEALQEELAGQITNFGQAIINGISRSEAARITRLPLQQVEGDDVPLVNPGLRPLADVAAGDAGFDGSEDLLPKVEDDEPEPTKNPDDTDANEDPEADETETD